MMDGRMVDVHWDPREEIGHARIDHERQVFVDLIRSVLLDARHGVPTERAAPFLSAADVPRGHD